MRCSAKPAKIIHIVVRVIVVGGFALIVSV